MGKRKEIGLVVPKITVLQPTVLNVSNPIGQIKDYDLDWENDKFAQFTSKKKNPVEDVATEGVDECFNLDLAEDLQNEIVPDSGLKRGILRGKLNKIEEDRRFGDFDNRIDGK